MNSMQQAQAYIANLLNSNDPRAQAQGRALAQTYQTNPDKIAILARNDALGQWADTEVRRQTQQSQIDNLNKQAADPNTSNQIWSQSWQKALQQFSQAGGLTPTRNEVMGAAQKLYEKNMGLAQQNITSNLRGLYAQVSQAQGQQDKLSEDKRPDLSSEQTDKLTQFQNGANLYNNLSDAYINLVKKYPWLGNPITGEATAKLKQIQNDPDVIAYNEKYREIFSPQIARGVSGDKGTISQMLQEKAASGIPQPGNSIDSVNQARSLVLNQVAQSYNNTLRGYQNSLFKTGGWDLMDSNNPATYGGQSPTAGPDANGNYGADQNQQPQATPQQPQPTPQAQTSTPQQQNAYSSAMQVIDSWNKGNTLAKAKMNQQQQQAAAQQQQQALQQQYQIQQSQNQNALNMGAIAAQRGQ